MALDVYWIALIALAPTSVLLAGRSYLVRPFQRLTRGNEGDKQDRDDGDDSAHQFRRTFLQVYLLVMGSEWLQGPYMYSLLRDEKSLSEPTVSSLYATAYASAALSACFVGFLADRFGRRKACLAFCALHSLSSLSVVSSSLPVIFAGRALAGVALTLLWTVFESWMITEYAARGLDGSSVPLSALFGVMTTSNCTAAILGGVLGHCIVLALGSKAHPFIVGIVLDAVGAWMILRKWNENYGARANSEDEIDDEVGSMRTGRLSGLFASGLDFRVWMLSFISCSFEGTNFLVLFFWPGMLQDARRRQTLDNEDGEVPYGVVFASFMTTMILGALSFNMLVRGNPGAGGSKSANWILAGAILCAGINLVVLAMLEHEIAIFAAFLAFEACNGAYLPSVAYHRGLVVHESDRTAVYGLMKIPLFVFVVWCLNMTAADDHRRRLLC